MRRDEIVITGSGRETTLRRYAQQWAPSRRAEQELAARQASLQQPAASRV